MKNYLTAPNFRCIYETLGLAKTKKLMVMIEEIRYMCYLTEHFEQGCESITEISHRLELDYIRLFNIIVSAGPPAWYRPMLCWQLVSELHKKIYDRGYKAFCKYYPMCMPTHYHYVHNSAKAFTDIIKERNIPWNAICKEKHYNKMENPRIVQTLLEKIFAPDDALLMKAQYGVEMYDYGDYMMSFITEKEMESFIEHFVKTGTACVLENGIWVELYAF